MKEQILEILQQIEREYDIKILYACESGSRAWGLSSKESDYDVRFLYIHKKEWYLSINEKRDVIEVPKHDSISIPVPKLLDINGWELIKALKLFRKSNPPLLEWLYSSIIYYQAFSTADRMRKLASTIFAPDSCLYHYLNMAKRNNGAIQNGQPTIKKYIYVLRPILAAKWIEMFNSIPPGKFQTLVDTFPFQQI